MQFTPKNPAVLFFGLALVAAGLQAGAYASAKRRKG